jgi:hypothetical protein
MYKALGGERLLVFGEVCRLDAMMVETHLDAHEAEKERHTGDREESGRWNTKIHAEGWLLPGAIGIQEYTLLS